MRLINDIGFDFFNAIDENTLLISSGTKKVSELNGISCIDDTYIQADEWRILTEAERNILLEPSNVQKRGNTIYLFPIPFSISYALLSVINKQIDSINAAEDIKKIEELSVYQNFTAQIEKFLFEKFSNNVNCYEPLGLDVNPKELQSISIDNNKCYVGLHLDNWDDKTINERHQSRDLFCINLGIDSRFLMFLNLSCLKMCELIKLKTGVSFDHSTLTPDELVTKFLDTYPDYPVLRLEIKPNEAYVFPIQNVIHEGFTVGKKFHDINFMSLGFFG